MTNTKINQQKKSRANTFFPIKTFVLISAIFFTISLSAKSVIPFDKSGLSNVGDKVAYGSYIIFKIGDGIYKINDPGVTTGRLGAFGVDMYLVCGEEKALMIDVGNNYMDGCKMDLIDPRENAAEELREVIYGLSGKRPLEITVTHAHPDHVGMTNAFTGRDVVFWMPEGEDLNMPKTMHNIDPAIYKLFKTGKKTFDLGGGRIIETFLVRGHSNGGTVYILPKDKIIFIGDALGSGFGQSFSSVDAIKIFAGDSKKLVDYISNRFPPFDRYALQVYSGHTYQNKYGGYVTSNKENVDIGYLDWRFIQNMASCASGVIEGKWLVKGSGLDYVGDLEEFAFFGPAGNAIMVYGIGAVVLPLKIAYEAAGLKIPE